MPGNEPIFWIGDGNSSQTGMTVILGELQAEIPTDVNGLASFALPAGGISGNVAVVGTATAGTSTVQYEAQQLGP